MKQKNIFIKKSFKVIIINYINAHLIQSLKQKSSCDLCDLFNILNKKLSKLSSNNKNNN